jgi:hypothetical protein
MTISAWQWPACPEFLFGPPATFVTFSNLQLVNSQTISFEVSVAPGAPSGNIAFSIGIGPDGGAPEIYQGVFISAPSPPSTPTPPSSPSCPTPAFAAENPMIPDTSMAGQTYPITVNGTGFTTAATVQLTQLPRLFLAFAVSMKGSASFSIKVGVRSKIVTNEYQHLYCIE